MTFVETNENTPSLIAGNVASRERQWMTLGAKVDHDMGVEEALALSGSDDFVYPISLYDVEGTMGDDGQLDTGRVFEQAVEGVTAVKSDKYGIMGIHGNGYTITQRRDILEMAYDITGLSKGDARIDTIGNFGNKNAKFFAYIKIPELVIDPNGIADTIERGLYVATSYDGSLPNIIGYSDMRITCLNQIKMIFKGLSQAIKVRHTRNAEDRMNQAARALQYVGAVDKQVSEQATRMLKVDGDKALDKLLDQFWPVDDSMADTGKTRRLRERGDVRMLYEGTGNTNIDHLGRTGWAAYNAVVEYFDHALGVKGVKGEAVNVRRAERAVLPGVITDKKIKASQMVLNMA